MNRMTLKKAKKAITENDCCGCEHLKEDNSGFECKSEEAHDCENHKVEAANIIISHLTQQLKEAKKAATDASRRLLTNDDICVDDHEFAVETLEKFGWE